VALKDIDEAFVSTSTEWYDPAREPVSNQQKVIDVRFIRTWANILYQASHERQPIPLAVRQVDQCIADLRVGD